MPFAFAGVCCDASPSVQFLFFLYSAQQRATCNARSRRHDDSKNRILQKILNTNSNIINNEHISLLSSRHCRRHCSHRSISVCLCVCVCERPYVRCHLTVHGGDAATILYSFRIIYFIRFHYVRRVMQRMTACVGVSACERV